MNKIIGMISAWGAEKWVGASIKQALNLCDEVFVNTGPFVKNMEQFTDNTRAICESFGDKITVVESDMAATHAIGKASTLNKILSMSKNREVGNWVWLFDVDEFYNETAIDKMKGELFTGDYNALRMDEMYFFINTTRYLKNERMRLWKIEDATHHFVPTNRWTGARDKKLYCPYLKYFHYSALMDQTFKKELWKTECNSFNSGQREKVDWVNNIYMKYELDNEEPWINLNEKLYGEKQPYHRSDFRPDKDGKLFVYEGKHPKVIEDAGFTKIKDFRKI